MGKIFRGHIQDEDKMINAFMNKYQDYIYKQKEEHIEPLDWKDVKNACSNTNSAGGFDIWTKKELHMISD